MRTRISLILPLICSPLAFWGCGGDGSSTKADNEKSDIIASTYDDLPVCSGKREGATAYIKDEKTAYICEDGKWVEDEENSGNDDDSDDVSSSSSKSKSSSSGDADEDDTKSSSSGKAESSSSVVPGTSSSVIPSEVEGSSSSVASSSSAKSSSSVASSSSEKSSSSVASSSSSSSSVIQSSSSEETSIKDGSKYDASANTLTDLRDNQVYKTVTIGTQIWMAENLNYAYKGVKYSYSSYTSDSTSWCYDNKASNCDKYGRLYTWSTVMDSAAQFNVNAGTKCGYGKTCTPNSPHRGICPEGWHVPTNEEYSTLYTNIGGASTAGSLLKSTSGWYNSGNGSDKYGFSVLPAGLRYDDGGFYYEGYYANMWSASEYSGSNACLQYFYYSYDDANQSNYGKGYGLSLRCLKD